jgi:outer membrane lipoprotein-sorting protein
MTDVFRPRSRGRFAMTAALVCAVLSVVVGLATSAGGQELDSATAVLDQMKKNGSAVADLDATITIQTYTDGEVSLTQQMRLLLLQPDKMRQEYLSPDYLAGNVTLIVGDSMWIYVSASDTWYASDLSTLSAAEQPWLAFRQILRDVQSELDDYAFELVGMEDGAYYLRGTPATDQAVYGLIELWVDPTSFVPRRRILYDIDGNRLVEVRILDVEQVADGAFIARQLETYDADGALASVVHYDTIVVNQGVDLHLFDAPTESTDG